MPASPDVNDTELRANVLDPLTAGDYFEALIFIRSEPEAPLYWYYARKDERSDPPEEVELAIDMHAEAAMYLNESRREIQFGDDGEDDGDYSDALDDDEQ
jgi:hypothetical protein